MAKSAEAKLLHRLRLLLMGRALFAGAEGAVLLGVLVVKRDVDDEERLVTVNSEIQRLSRLVNALLKLSRLENRADPMSD